MIRNMVFDIGNVLMDFRWKEYMHSLFGENEALIQAINRGIWHNGCWAAMDKGEMDGAATLRSAIASAPQYEKEIRQTIANAAHAFHKNEYAVPWVQELKKLGFHVYYLSNYSAFSIKAITCSSDKSCSIAFSTPFSVSESITSFDSSSSANLARSIAALKNSLLQSSITACKSRGYISTSTPLSSRC